jgi:hypothetical protein
MSSKNQKDKKKIGKKGIPEESEADKVPPLRFDVVQQLIAYLEAAKGLEEVGLFRESAPLTEVKKLYSQFFNGTSGRSVSAIYLQRHSMLSDKVDMSQVFDPHVAAGALKLYFREQTEALIPVSTCQEYSDAASTCLYFTFCNKINYGCRSGTRERSVAYNHQRTVLTEITSTKQKHLAHFT